jgi:spore maturation protein CgeB
MTPWSSSPRVFGIDYAFLSCGDVFTQGLAHAAATLGVPYAHALWNDPDLLVQMQRFAPDLVFVVHGRRAAESRRTLPCPSAVWLVDEPYEVDDTAAWSSKFDHVFVNDTATLARHQHASYLPVCYDPQVHHLGETVRTRPVGFIGGGNPTRDRVLGALARAHLLSYVVGGIWSDPDVNRVCLSRQIPPHTTATLYRETQIVVNIFRERHHYNREQIPATSLNPRVYEALACGALVVSEWRPEVDTLVPELPTFRTAAEAVDVVHGLLADPARAETLRVACAARLAEHTYAARLRTVLTTCGLAVGVAA